MYGDMAANAFAASLEAQAAMRHLCGVKFRVAFQAKLAPLATHQQHTVVAPVRIVAGDASFNFHRGMFEYKRSALLHVAFEARLVAAVRLVKHARGFPHAERRREAAVRIVAVGAVHEAFVDPVLAGQGELRRDVGVASVAKLRLALG